MYCFVDLNQVLIANLMLCLSNPNFVVEDEKGNATKFSEGLTEGLIRHTSLNTLRSNIKQFKSKYPNFVLCCDNKHYWRKDFFPFYKAHRRADREASAYDWGFIFDSLNKVRDELKQYSPYKVIDVDGAEADDVIAVLTARLAPHGNVLILSSDKDFAQLQKYPNVSQYSPMHKRFIKVDDPQRYIREHIMRGDRGDGIPNFLSADNCIVTKERQKPLSSKKLNEWITKDASEFCTTDVMLHGYKRNQTLVDFECIPDTVRTKIVEAFEQTKPASKETMLNYFMKNKLKALIEDISDF